LGKLVSSLSVGIIMLSLFSLILSAIRFCAFLHTGRSSGRSTSATRSIVWYVKWAALAASIDCLIVVRWLLTRDELYALEDFLRAPINVLEQVRPTIGFTCVVVSSPPQANQIIASVFCRSNCLHKTMNNRKSASAYHVNMVKGRKRIEQ
jgi:hypothetical protein